MPSTARLFYAPRRAMTGLDSKSFATGLVQTENECRTRRGVWHLRRGFLRCCFAASDQIEAMERMARFVANEKGLSFLSPMNF